MCGIGGIITFTRPTGKRKELIKRITKNLLKELESRGTDASGIALIDHQHGREEVFKMAIPGSKLAEKQEFENTFKNEFDTILIHTRAATTGTERRNVNNHPHQNKITGNVLIHNGVINNYPQLIKDNNLQMDGDCDSEVILKLADKIGFDEAMKKLKGSFAVALTKRKKKQTIIFRGDYSPLFLMYIPQLDCYVFASTEDIAINSVYNAKARTFGNLEMEKSCGQFFYKELSHGDKVIFNHTLPCGDVIHSVVEEEVVEDKFKLTKENWWWN